MEIAVIITTYNRSKLLKRAIESVLDQNFSQIIVVDDCSSDDTFNTVDFYTQKTKKLSYLKMDKNSGVNTCRNRAIRSVFCDWVAFLDDDDEFVFDAFDVISNKIQTIPKNIDVMYFNTIINRDNEKFVGGFQFSADQKYYDPSYFETMTKFNLKGDCKPVFRKSLFDENYSFPESVNGFESYLMNKIARDGRGIRYFSDITTIVNFTSNISHISHTAPRKNPKPLLDLHIRQLTEHKNFYNKHPVFLAKKYLDMAKLSFRASAYIKAFIFLMRYFYLKFLK